MKVLQRFLLVFLMLLLALPASGEHSVEEVRNYYNAIQHPEELYAARADLTTNTVSVLTEEATQSVLTYCNFIRWLAYVDNNVTVSDTYTELASDGALLLAISEQAAHELPKPDQFSDALYASASEGIGASNIASINWFDKDVLLTALDSFMRDEGTYNAGVLGHRLWLLNPALAKTGFGMANSTSGMTYITMYVHDYSGSPIQPWEYIAWPSQGAFPAEFIYQSTPWSIIINPDAYPSYRDAALSVTVSCDATGESYTCNTENGSLILNDDAYGLGAALIFTPPAAQEYVQNQNWHVILQGLADQDGSPVTIDYTVCFISLQPVPVRLIELDTDHATLKTGDTQTLHAEVIPDWADDVSIHWVSDSPEVASVSEDGTITAHKSGACVITVNGADGQSASCTIQVEE